MRNDRRSRKSRIDRNMRKRRMCVDVVSMSLSITSMKMMAKSIRFHDSRKKTRPYASTRIDASIM